jgi:hypothetical protein
VRGESVEWIARTCETHRILTAHFDFRDMPSHPGGPDCRTVPPLLVPAAPEEAVNR